MVSIPTIMSTKSSCQPPIIKQLESVTVRKRVNSRMKTISRNPVFLGKVASVVAEVGSLFPWIRGSICKSCRQKKRTTPVAGAWFCPSNCLKTGDAGALLEDEVGKKVARARWHKRIEKLRHSEQPNGVRAVDGVWMLLDLVRRLLLFGFASSCEKTHWHGCPQQSMSDDVTLLASGIAAGGCQTPRER